MRKRRQTSLIWLLGAAFILLLLTAPAGCGGGGGGGGGGSVSGQEQGSNWDAMLWDRGTWR